LVSHSAVGSSEAPESGGYQFQARRAALTEMA